MESDAPLTYSLQQSFETDHLLKSNAAFEVTLTQESGRMLSSDFIDSRIPDLNILKIEPQDKIKKAEFVKLSNSKFLLLIDFHDPDSQKQTELTLIPDTTKNTFDFSLVK